MAFCTNCGNKLESGVNFCPTCGAAVNTPAKETPAAEIPVTPAAEPFVTSVPTKADADAMINEVFGKGIAATICASFPVASIIAIVLGSKTLNKWSEAKALAEKYGFSLTGKHIPTRILGLIGKIGGIVMTAFWAVYFIILIAAFA